MAYLKKRCFLGVTGLLLALTGISFSATTEEPQNFDCVIVPSAIVGVSTAVPGVLESVSVKRSDRVEKGQLLAALESDVEVVERDLARVRAETEAAVKLREVSLMFDQRSLRRVKSLHRDKVISIEDKDKAEREATLAGWRLQDARDLLRQRALELQRSEQVLTRRQVHSPIDGIIAQRLHHPGEYVEDTPILRIAQLDPLYIEAIVPMTEFGSIKPGMRATVASEINPDNLHSAEVVVVDGMGDAASGTFGIRLSLPNPDYRIPAGVKCQMRLEKPQVAAVPDPELDPEMAMEWPSQATSSAFDNPIIPLPNRKQNARK